MSTSIALPRRTRIDLLAATLLTLLCLAWGVQQVAIKVAITHGLPPVFQAALRSVIAVVCVCAWEAARGELRGLLRRDGAFRLGMLAGLLFGAEFVAMFAGLARTSAERGVIVLYTAPFFVAAGAHLLIPGERMRARQWLGLLLAFAAVASVEAGASRNGGGGIAGDAMVLAGAVLWAATSLLVKGTRLARLPAAKVVLYQLAGSVPVLFACSAVAGESWSLHGVAPVAWWALLYQGAGVAGASYLVWFWLMARYPVSRISAFTFLTPVFGVLAAALLLGDAVTPAVVLALVGVAVGLRLINARPVEG